MLKRIVKRMRTPAQGKFIVFEGITCSGKSLQSRLIAKNISLHGRKVLLNREPTDVVPFGRAIRERIEDTPITKEFVAQELVPATATLVRELRQSLNVPVPGMAPDERGRLLLAFCGVLSGAVDRLRDDAELDEQERQFLFLADRCCDLRDTIIPALMRGEWVVEDRYDLSTIVYGSTRGLAKEDLYKMHVAVLGPLYRIPDVTLHFRVSPEEALDRLERSGKRHDRYETVEKIGVAAEAYEEVIHYLIGKSVDAANAGHVEYIRRFISLDAEKRPEDVTATVIRLLHQSGFAKWHRKKK